MPPEHFRERNLVLAGLDPSDLSLIRPHLSHVFVAAGTVLQGQDRYFEHVYFPHDGLISLIAGMADTAAIEIAAVGREGAFCAPSEMGWRTAFATAVARTPLRASRISALHLRSLLAESSALGAAIENCIEDLQLQLRQTAICNALHSVEERVVRWLVQAAERLQDDALPVTQATVAQLLGVRRTTVTLVAAHLQGVGAIRWRRSRVEILDRIALEQLACGCHAALRRRVRRLRSAASNALTIAEQANQP